MDAAGPDGPINANVPNPTHHYFLSGRVFHDYGQANQFWMGYSYEHRTIENLGVGGTVLPSAGTNTLFFEHEVNVGHVYIFSPRLLNQLHFLLGHFDNQTHSLTKIPSSSFPDHSRAAAHRPTHGGPSITSTVRTS